MDVTLTFTADEQRAFLELIDAALRHAGAGALDVAAHFKGRLRSAAEPRLGSMQPTGQPPKAEADRSAS